VKYEQDDMAKDDGESTGMEPMSDIDAVLAERGKTHGNFNINCKVSQQIKRNLREFTGWHKLDESKRESLDMIAHKIGRIIAGDPDFADHWVDIAGYAQLVANDLTNPPAGG